MVPYSNRHSASLTVPVLTLFFFWMVRTEFQAAAPYYLSLRILFLDGSDGIPMHLKSLYLLPDFSGRFGRTVSQNYDLFHTIGL